MQNLKMTDKYFDALEQGRHNAEVYLGDQDISLGELQFTSAEDGITNINVSVHTVVHTTYARLSPEQIDAVGLGSRSDLFTILRGRYPDFTTTSEVTFIQWG